MKKTTIIAALFLTSAFALAQTGRVGINTETPQTTLDVTGKKDAGGTSLATDVTGLQAPRLTRAELTAKGNALYTATQKGALVYITDISGGDAGATSPRKNVNSIGYYYFDGTDWQKFLDTDTAVLPTGFERLPNMTATDFHWRLIGADPANYGTAGKYGLDATWNPTDLNETVSAGGFDTSYGSFMVLGYLSASDLGAKGKNSFTAGAVNSASGNISTALGAGNASIGDGSFAVGLANHSEGHLSAAIGRENWTLGDVSFAAGNSNRIEATGTSSVAMGIANSVSGDNAIAMGQQNVVSAQAAVAIGNSNNATGISAFAMGQDNGAEGQASMALGTESAATGQNAVALGKRNTATGEASLSMGGTSGNIASGTGSIAIGNKTAIAQSAYSTAMGLNNTLETLPETTGYTDLTKRLFVIGNGGDAIDKRSDALTILRNGKTGIGESVPANRLHVKDTADPLRLEGVLGTSDNTVKTLVIDTNGVVKTSNLQKTKFGGYIETTSNLVITPPAVAGTITKVIVTNEQVDLNSEYDPTTGIFSPKETGVYTYEFAMTYHNRVVGTSTAPDDATFGTSADRGVIGIVDNATAKWISRANFEASSDERFFLAKGVVTLTAGQSYYFGASGPTNKALTLVVNPTGTTGSGIGTYFDFTRIK